MAARTLRKLQDRDEWAEMREGFLASRDGATLQPALTQAVDGVVREAFDASSAVRFPICVMAVSGFGRGDLYPYSDADIALICEADALTPQLKDAVSQFLNLVRQQGVRPNHRLTTIEDCLELRERSIDTSIGLLDRRLVAGDRALGARAERELSAFFSKHAQKVCQHICELAKARHARYRGTPFHLEPDVREAPGGSRDLRLLGALSRLSPGQAGLDDSLELSAQWIASLRCYLHYRAGDDHNLFDADSQAELSAADPKFSLTAYFEAARRIFNAARRALESFDKSSSLLESFRALQSRLSNHEFTVSREHVFLRKASELAADPMMAFRLAEFIAQHGIAPAPETERRLEAERASIAAFCAQPQPIWSSLKTTLAQPHAPMALRMLRDVSVLGAMMPEWAAIEGKPPADADHRYTMDENALASIDGITELRAPSDALRQRFAELLSEVEDLPALMFALLMQNSSGDAAREASRRIQAPDASQEIVRFLVERQSELSDAASGRDLDNPVTLRLLAGKVGTVERLKLLAAMSYARLSALDDDATTGFRLEQLWRTYSATQHELMQELETDRINTPPEDMPAYAAFLKGFPLRYLRSRTAADIEGDARLYEQSRPTGVAVKIERLEGVYRMTIAARDAPFLFASFAGAISSFGLDIVKAEAFSNSRGAILDTFVFIDPKRTLELNPSESERLHDLILRVARGKTDATRLLRNRGRSDSKKRTVMSEVRFDSEACETATLVEIVTEDRQGLLFSLATVFSSNGCNIDVVLIDTKGHKAIDVFYVAQEGKKLSPETQEALKEKILEVC